MVDFFVSYNKVDRTWAEWVAWVLEEDGRYSTVLQAWDFQPGTNFVLEMQRASTEAERTIAILSDAYLQSLFTQPEWAAAFRNDPTSVAKALVPVRVQDCRADGLLGSIVYIDLVGRLEADARETLLKGVAGIRSKPTRRPPFPGEQVGSRTRPVFPAPAVGNSETESLSAPSSTNTALIVQDEFLLFQNVYDFAVNRMAKTSTGGEEFARTWVRDYPTVNFERFKEAYSFACEKMAKTSTGAEIFALGVIKGITRP